MPGVPCPVSLQSLGLDVLGAALLVTGLLLMLAGAARLGSSLRMGLPAEKTALITSGPYRYARKPGPILLLHPGFTHDQRRSWRHSYRPPGFAYLRLLR